METKYWAAAGPDKIASNIMAKVDSYKEYVEQSGLLTELRKSYNTFYGSVHIKSVDQSLKAIHINHYASYVRNIHNIVTGSRPAWETRAINTDLESQADTQLASGLLDYYMREKHIETKLTDSCLKALFLKEGWISLGWNATGGEVYGTNPETGLPIYEGDFECNTHTILDVVRDVRKRDLNHDWYVLRQFKNKYDLAAKYPELAEKIEALKPDNRFDIEYELGGVDTAHKLNEDDTDLVATYTLLHKKTEAMPQGRMVEICNDEITLFDGPLPYKDVYLFPITSGQQFDTAFGHSYLMDLLPVQDAFDMCVSAILTNQAANSVQNFQVPKGAAPKVTQVMDGMNVWEYDPKAGKMESMDLLKTAPEVFNFAGFLTQQGDLISNVSQIGRGNAPTNMSGTAMALLQQQAIQSTSGVSMSYTFAQENVGTALIELLQTFAVVPRIAMIAGKSKRSMLKSFSNKDLQGIGRVYVDRANPLTKTGAGRMEIANNLLAAPNMISTPEQYLGVLTTGNLEPLYQRDNSQRMLVLSENEKLMEGAPVQALMTDNHPTHILEHSCVLDSPEARENPQVVQSTLAHIQEHMNLAKSMDPAMAMTLKQASLFQPPPQPQAPPDGSAAQVMNPTAPASEIAEKTALPSPAEPPNPNAFQGV